MQPFFKFNQLYRAESFKILNEASYVNLISYALKFTNFKVDKFRRF